MIAGKYQPGRGDMVPVEGPSKSTIFAYCHSASKEDVDRTVELAHDAFKSGVWSRLLRHIRADVLERASALLTAHLPELIALEVQQTGRAIREMNAQVPSLIRWFKYYAALLRTEGSSVLPTQGKLHNWVDCVPLGVVVQITPFNHPLLVKKIAPALAAGNSVIVKPSELTPLTTLRLGELLAEAGVAAVFETEEEAVTLANDSEFGLGAAVWTQNLSQAYRVSEQIEAWIVWVNTHHCNDPSSPWGGAKSASGVGSENGIDAYHAYTNMKSTVINYAFREESLAADDWFREGGGSVRYG